MYIQISRYQINKILQLKALVNLEYTYTRINKQLVKEERTKTELMNRSFEVSNLDRTKNIEVIRFVLLKVEINKHIEKINVAAIDSNSMLWQPLVTKTNSNTASKSLNRISSGNHKRTQQEVSAVLLLYLYKVHMVHATNN